VVVSGFCYYCFAVVDFVLVAADFVLAVVLWLFLFCHYSFVVDFVLVVVDFVLVVISTTAATSIFATTNTLKRQRTKYIAQSTLLLPALHIFTSNTFTLSRHAVTISVRKTIHPGHTAG
jgi:hypothetical protein